MFWEIVGQSRDPSSNSDSAQQFIGPLAIQGYTLVRVFAPDGKRSKWFSDALRINHDEAEQIFDAFDAGSLDFDGAEMMLRTIIDKSQERPGGEPLH